MKFTAQRETLLRPLQAVAGVVERRQTMPILANFLLVAKDNQLSVTATDLEVELVATTELDLDTGGEITVPGRKLLDICRALPEGAKVSVSTTGDRLVVKSGRSRFTLSTLAASDFPSVEDIQPQQTLKLAQRDCKRLLDKTHFAMAHQDVRYYLNGLLLDVSDAWVRAVATDGHRLALCEMPLDGQKPTAQQVIVPRKGVLELQRLLGDEGDIDIAIGSNHIRMQVGSIRFTSKLVDGRFPEYDRVIPSKPRFNLATDCDALKHALQRAAILSNEKYRGIRFGLADNLLRIQAHNPEQEEAEEELEVEYDGDAIEIGFNVNYLLDALGSVEGDKAEILLTDTNSSCLIQEPGMEHCKYVVMPMRL
ncbi:MAG: DNA polymerase III subunit beta [Gammaproteobacteria bacterium]|nr:DNA polymerase III subunit beta [Gammaproteobacteria bacterium]MDH3767064.1 DNA polymerase III subunit beta [Gammaproteobacteria bacterium]